MLSEIFKPIGKLIIIAFVEFIILFFNLNNRYDRNAFKIKINNHEMYAYYAEQYRSVIFPFLLDSRNSIHSPNSIQPVINEIPYDSNMQLELKEFQTYNKKNERESSDGWYFSSNYVYKEVKVGDTYLLIKRKNKILYEGKYISNISKYIIEPGRYFFQIKVGRNTNFYTSVKTHINFNVIVSGDANE